MQTRQRSIYEVLIEYFDQGRFGELITFANSESILPESDPRAASIVAGAFFKLGKFSECLSFCERLMPSLEGDKSLVAMYGAALRRCGNLKEASSVLETATKNWPGDTILLNNYANVLIDLGKLDDALSILQEIRKEDPVNSDDVNANYNRVRFLIEQRAKKSGASSESLGGPGENSLPTFADPLDEAFESEEVCSPINISQKAEISNLPGRDQEGELGDLLKLAQQLAEINPEECIEECRRLHNRSVIVPELYRIAGDAYIRLRLFGDAEVAFMTSLLLDAGGLVSTLINLANLAAMRGDWSLAMKWLERASAMDASNMDIKKASENLFPHGLPNNQTPFQINYEQQTPGEVQ